MYRVFRLAAGQASLVENLFKDNLAGRQSITIREARTLGVPGEGSLVLVEGSDEGVARADALLEGTATKVTGADAESAYLAFRKQEDEAASGMGLVFGP